MRKMVLPALIMSVLLPTIPAFGGGSCGKPTREPTQETGKKKKPPRVRRWFGCATPQNVSAATGSSLTQSKPLTPPASRVKKLKLKKPTEARAESILVTIPGLPPTEEVTIHDDISTIGQQGSRSSSTHLEEPCLVQSISAREEAGDPDIIAQASHDEALEEKREELEGDIAAQEALRDLLPTTDSKRQEIETNLRALKSLITHV